MSPKEHAAEALEAPLSPKEEQAPTEEVQAEKEQNKATEVQAPTKEDDTEKEQDKAAEVLRLLIDAGRNMEKELKQNEALGLAPSRSLRIRRKSKELQAKATDIMSADLERIFNQFDLDGNGTLDASELKAAFEAAGQPASDEAIARSMKVVDKDGDGTISFEEFKSIAWLNLSRGVNS